MTYEITHLIDFINQSPSYYHSIDNMKNMLKEAGFQPLKPGDRWDLTQGKGYYVINQDSALIAFRLGTESLSDSGFAIIGSHSDSPTFKLKTFSGIQAHDHYHTLNTEVYGGPILSSWFDRPLSIAGRAFYEDEQGSLKSRLFNIDKDLLIIPSLAIHLNRDINNGYKYNAQKDTLPLVKVATNEPFCIDDEIAKELNISPTKMLAFDAMLYDRQKGALVGADCELINIGKLDNLAMAHASLKALINSDPKNFTQVCVVFDHEEVGSQSSTGAGGTFLKDTLERLCLNEGIEGYLRAMSKSMIISADQAHAVHPNYLEKHDPTHHPLMGLGPVVKVAANQSYTSNAMSISILKRLAKIAKVPLQFFHNPSNQRGGSTIGPINSTQLNILSVDIGNPLLAMHSIRELGHCKDQEYMYLLLKSFYENFSLD